MSKNNQHEATNYVEVLWPDRHAEIRSVIDHTEIDSGPKLTSGSPSWCSPGQQLHLLLANWMLQSTTHSKSRPKLGTWLNVYNAWQLTSLQKVMRNMRGMESVLAHSVVSNEITLAGSVSRCSHSKNQFSHIPIIEKSKVYRLAK